MTKLPTSKTALMFVFFFCLNCATVKISQNCPLPPEAIILINLFSFAATTDSAFAYKHKP